jgi:hypothetical protein
MSPNGGGLQEIYLLQLKAILEVLKNLKQNSVKLEQHNLVQDGLGLCSKRWKTRCLWNSKSRQSINAWSDVVEQF